MLGRLLHLGSGGQSTPLNQAASNISRPILSLESVQEDAHTRNLLFPDAHALYQHRNDQVFPLSTAPATPSASTANSFDYSDDVELDVKDVRVIIMQDALGPTNASLLFDSHPLSNALTSTERLSTTQDFKKSNPLSPRKGSQSQTSRPLSIHADGPQPRQGAFDRRASVHSRSHSYAETDGQRAAREYREELATFSSCIFGNSELMAYKGTSTKVHVVPSESRFPDHAGSIIGDGRSSIGRSGGRSSKLSQSYSSQTVSPTNQPILPTGISTPRQSDRKKVLITRLFPVTLAADDLDANITPPGRYSDDNGGFPFPATNDDPFPKKKKPQPKQRRTPMYAVVVVVHLPPSPSRISSAVPPKQVFREPGSYNDQELFSSSYNSTRMSGWNMSGSGIYGDATDSSFSIDVEDRIDSLTQHWDIIMRTLTHMQSVVASTLHTMLKQADMTSPGSLSSPTGTNLISRTPSLTERRDGMRVKPAKGTTKLVSLWPNCLSDNVDIALEVGLARTRIVMGVSAARVVTGQGRWGIWRDEAIWTSKWAAASNQGSFFYNLLTGFLATHTDWLQALCTAPYRRRAILQKQNQSEDDLSLPSRTVIVSDDKMAARRLIFLLSAFLPTNQQVAGPRAHRPSTSASVAAFSNSPPTYVVPVLREESLRRKINRRTGLRRASHSRTTSQSVRTPTMPPQVAYASMDASGHHRRASDAASIRTTNLPIPGNDIVSRKSSAATSTTIMADSTIPHFTTVQRSENLRRPRPGSSSSVAADDLKRSLKRGESTGTINSRPTSQGLKWGSIMSGLWSARRRESIDGGNPFSQTSDLRSPVKASFGQPNKLTDMVRELSLPEEGNEDSLGGLHETCPPRDVNTPRDNAERGRRSISQMDRTPDPTGAFESPVKTSINADDGVIDVDVPFPDYIASFESAISSPSSSGYLSTPGLTGLESFEQSGRISVDGDLPLNAAGWLSRFHPDFSLQALPPQYDLEEEVRAALRAEPTQTILPSAGHDLTERWIDVSSAVIADTITGTVKRITYRRLVKPKAIIERPAGGVTVLTPSVLPYETHLDEEWIEELVTSPDEPLTEALERVINFSTDVSKEHSAASSQRNVDIHGSNDGESIMPDELSEVTQLAETPLDIPRMQCKAVILSALEDTIRDVITEREKETEIRGHRRRKSRGHQSILRDAVNNWASNLDSSE